MKKSWPTEAVMTQIYEKNLWGGKNHDFYSGTGSHDPKIIKPYLKAIRTFFEAHDNSLVVCDLGCGDFNIGKQLTKYTKKYIAIDIVDNLIERNKTKFRDEHLEFHCLDMAKDKLPIADCIILRQVLQHLSNTEIQSIVDKLKMYNYIILTEHLPTGNFVPNKDIVSGQGIRLKFNSGVDLLEAPFNLKITKQSLLSNIILDQNKGQITTILFTL